MFIFVNQYIKERLFLEYPEFYIIQFSIVNRKTYLQDKNWPAYKIFLAVQVLSIVENVYI